MLLLTTGFVFVHKNYFIFYFHSFLTFYTIFFYYFIQMKGEEWCAMEQTKGDAQLISVPHGTDKTLLSLCCHIMSAVSHYLTEPKLGLHLSSLTTPKIIFAILPSKRFTRVNRSSTVKHKYTITRYFLFIQQSAIRKCVKLSYNLVFCFFQLTYCSPF